MARISKSTAVVLIAVILAGAGGAIFAIVHAHRKHQMDPARWGAVAAIGSCVRHSARDAIALQGLESKTELDGATLAPVTDCTTEATLLANAPELVIQHDALARFAKESLDFRKASLDLTLYLERGKKRIDKGKGKKLVAALAKERDTMVDAAARAQANLATLYAAEIGELGTLDGTKRAAVAIATELETIADEAERQQPDHEAMAASAKKIQTVAAHDPALRARVAAIPWLVPLVETGVLAVDAPTEDSARPFWLLVKP